MMMSAQSTFALLPRLRLLSMLIIINPLVTMVASTHWNIDTEQLILREVNGLADGSLFGYSLVLHQTLSNPSNMDEAISGARIVVSAPKGTAPGGSVPNTGLVYSCPVNPGTCSPLPGKLFDTTSNNVDENKTDQFLGASMTSNGERFMVCAHRYARIFVSENITYPFPLGKCFFSNRDLQRFTEYQPCSQETGQLSPLSIGVCQTGVSSTIVPDGGSYAYGLGAPGFRTWAGTIIRRNSGGSTNIQDPNSEAHAYQGYAITSGRFMSQNRQDFAVSSPRKNTYFGSVNIVMNDNSLQFISQPLMGMQMGEYYGFSLLAVDLNGDNYDELFVGAPLYTARSTEPETGRVFLYRNIGGNLAFVRTIEGLTRYSRFGYAMANLGDINGDGLDDVAISAPFSETGSGEPGTVFIYHSTPTLLLSNEPQQVIRGTDLSLTMDLSGLRGFGTSLASGVDVDLNSYNDLLVGSFLSQQVFLLRTRPFAHTQVMISANPLIVDVLDRTRPECMINSTQFACFNLTACATYIGRGLAPTLNLRFTISGDVENVERRIVFENGNTKIKREISPSINTQLCTIFKAYIRNSLQFDIFNPFIMDLSVDIPPRDTTPGNGNETLRDLSGFPVVMVTGTSQVQVETLKECGGGECIPDLRISVTGTQINPSEYGSSTIIAGFKSSVEIYLDVENAAEDAFQASLSFILPTNLLKLINIFNQTRNGEVTLRCLSEPFAVNQLMDQTRHSCSIGNPFLGPGSLQLRVQLLPSNYIIGSEDDIIVNFTVDSINPENVSTIVDDSNFDRVQLMFEARANITADNGVVTPERISYSDNSAITDEGVALTNVSQLGPPVDISFLIRNSGPSRIANIQLDISWPLNSSITGENYYLYITSIQSSGVAAVTCSNQYINPLGLGSDGNDSDEQEQGGDPTVGMGTGRRKKRSTVKRTLRNKRQEASTEQGMSENVTLSCMSSESDIMINCVNIRCTLLGLPGSSSVQVDVNARLDERFFSTNNDHYIITPTALIDIVDGDFIKSNKGSSHRSASAQIFVIPAAHTIRVNPELEPKGSSSVAWWVIVTSILAAVIVITVVGVLLRVFGFFHRRKHEEIKQRREEIQNLDNHGITLATAANANTEWELW